MTMRIDAGRSFDAFDEQQRRKVAIIGARVESQLFGKDERALRHDVTINGMSFQVIGVFHSLSNGNQQQEEEKIYLPNDTLRYAFNQVGWVGNFVVLPKPGVQARVAEEDVKRYLANKYRVNPDDKGVFGSFNLQNEYDKIQGLFTGIKMFSWVVAIGTILAGAIGVGNIMLIVVKERTREIGLRKALGATPASIVLMVMQESVFITAIAGYAGLVVGTLVIQAIATMLGPRPSMLNVNSAESQLQTSKINLANQAADLERYQKLFAQHLISETDFNQFTMNFNVQKEAVGSAENAGHQRRRPDD